MSNQINDRPIEFSIFFCRKALDNSTELIIRSDLNAFPAEHRCGYGFTITLDQGDNVSTAEVKDLTSDQTVAEKFFNLLVEFNVSPLHLHDVAEDFLLSFYDGARVQ